MVYDCSLLDLRFYSLSNTISSTNSEQHGSLHWFSFYQTGFNCWCIIWRAAFCAHALSWPVFVLGRGASAHKSFNPNTYPVTLPCEVLNLWLCLLVKTSWEGNSHGRWLMRNPHTSEERNLNYNALRWAAAFSTCLTTHGTIRHTGFGRLKESLLKCWKAPLVFLHWIESLNNGTEECFNFSQISL